MLFRAIFGLDPRSLALLRIGLGCTLLLDLVSRAWFLEEHYTDGGILSRADLLAQYPRNLLLSAHLCSGELSVQVLLFVLHALVALALTLGYRTRLASVLAFLLLNSLQVRNPLVFFMGDDILRLTLFWGMFLPLGEVWSLDRRGAPVNCAPVVSVGSAGYLLQIGFVYFFTGAQKFGPEWTQEGSAVLYSLSTGQYESAAGHWLRDLLVQSPSLTRALTFSVLAWEFAFLGLLLIPGWPRFFTVCSALFFQASLAVFMSLGWFPLFSSVAMLGLFPRQLFDLRGVGAESPRPPEPLWRQSLAGLALGLVVMLNLATWPGVGERPVALHRLTWGVGLHQHWLMFAPSPPRADNWPVARGVLADGREVNLFRPEMPLSFERPALVPQTFQGVRWGMYFFRIYSHRVGQRQRELFADMLVRRWNRSHLGEPVVQVELYSVERPILAYRGWGQPERKLLLRKDYRRGPELTGP